MDWTLRNHGRRRAEHLTMLGCSCMIWGVQRTHRRRTDITEWSISTTVTEDLLTLPLCSGSVHLPLSVWMHLLPRCISSASSRGSLDAHFPHTHLQQLHGTHPHCSLWIHSELAYWIAKSGLIWTIKTAQLVSAFLFMEKPNLMFR